MNQHPRGTTFPERLTRRLKAALVEAGLPNENAQVTPAADPRFGDYQSNIAMTLAKPLRQSPREIAARIINHLEVGDLSEPPTVAGAGFLNFRLLPGALEEFLRQAAEDPRMGVAETEKARRIVIDFSSPNIAKPMHVGHIRSTILGDCLARTARFLGHSVVTDNHVGDWGTQFGKVIYGWKHFLDRNALQERPLAELVRLYREVNALEERDPAVKEQVRLELVALQSGDPTNRSIWEETVALSWKAFEGIYDLLDIHFDERLGESFYNDALGPLVEDLIERKLARESEGAICVFFEEIPDLADKPCIIRKSDGGFLYATTDLATLQYRQQRWNPDDVWYVTGAPQALHFRQVFETARRMGLPVDARHVAFGSILGEDRKIMKTRSGENVQLDEVLQEAVERADRMIAEKNPEITGEEKASIARKIGIGAVKYAELSQNRMTDYVFSWEKMLSFQGNTAPYLQNAYVRIRSIFRKAAENGYQPGNPALNEKEERDLALQLAKFPEVVPLVLDDFRPNLLANYLYGLATSFHAFYESCPILKASDESIRASRLQLASTTAATLKLGLDLLGIEVPERM
jgi:arginyl-tRNA synthetase